MRTSIGVFCSLALACVFSSSAGAASVVYQGAAPFVATDIPAGWPSGFDVTASGEIVALVGRDVNLLSASGAFVRVIATVPDFDCGPEYGAFCRLSPDGSRVWAGFTTNGNANDRIYSAPFAGGAATHEATLPANYDLEFAKVAGEWKPFVSGANSANWDAPLSVWLLNTSGGEHTRVAQLGGYGSGIAFDSAGNLYATNQSTPRLYRFAASDVLKAAQGLSAFLTPDNASFSTDTAYGISDITTDGAGHVFFDANDPGFSGKSIVGMLQPLYAGPYKYDNIAQGIAGFNWSTQMAFGGGTGDVMLEQGAIYVGDYFGSGNVTMLTVPEPATAALVLMGALALVRRSRRARA